jgi:hypothetical protein
MQSGPPCGHPGSRIQTSEFHRIPKLKFGALLTEGGAERLELARA